MQAEAPAAHRPCLLAHRRSGGACACARVRIATARSLRAIGARRAAAACWQHSGTATTTRACTCRSIHAAGARRSRATGSSFGMNSRASQRADELAGADPANRAPLAHPRQLAGRSRPRIRLRGARFGDRLETGRLNGRPGRGRTQSIGPPPRQRLHWEPDSGRDRRAPMEKQPPIRGPSTRSRSLAKFPQ